jgi:hypothetical protein
MADTGLGTPNLNAFLPTPTESRRSDPSAEVGGLLDVITQQQFPARLGGLHDVLAAFTQRAAGSPRALQGLVSPELQKMAQQILALTSQASRSPTPGGGGGFGPYGGLQLDRAIGQAHAQQPLLSTFVNPTVQAGQNLANYMRGTSLIAPQGQTSSSTKPGPGTDLNEIMRQFAQLGPLAQQGYNTFWPADTRMAPSTIGGGYTAPTGGFSGGYGEFLQNQV